MTENRRKTRRKPAEYPFEGTRFSRWTICGPECRDKNGNRKATVRCDCGFESTVYLSPLLRGETQGCRDCKANRTASVAIEPGDWFGLIKVLRRVENDASGGRRYLCRCYCGEEWPVSAGSLRGNNTRSCGCQGGYASRLLIRYADRADEIKRLVKNWDTINRRCHNVHHPAYSRYGGRGVTVCDEWREDGPWDGRDVDDPQSNPFERFFETVGFKPSPQHSLDRIDNDGGYSPDNVRWATLAEQMANTRASQRYSLAPGHEATAANLPRHERLPFPLLEKRLRDGWPVLLATMMPGGFGLKDAAKFHELAAKGFC